MPMAGFSFGILGFVVALAVYGGLIRLRGSLRAAMLPSLTLFLSSLLTIVACLAAFRSPDWLDTGLLAWALAWSLAIAYLTANTAIETDSPTQSLVLFFYENRRSGVTPAMLDEFIRSHPFRDSRLQGLLVDRLVERRDGRLANRPGGQFALTVLEAHRRLIGRREVTG
jgi:hypothetical protein